MDRRHEGAAILAMFLMLITGALALVELWKRRHIVTEKQWSGTLLAILVFSLLTTAVMARVGTALTGLGSVAWHRLHHGPIHRLIQEIEAES